MYKSILMPCQGMRCMTNGSLDLIELLKKELINHGFNNDDYMLIPTGCYGMCQRGPAMIMIHQELGIVRYINIQEKDIKEIVEKTIMNGEIIERLYIEKVERED